MAHNPRKHTHQLGIEVDDIFFSKNLHVKCRGLQGGFESLSFVSFVAISNSYGGYTELLRYQLGRPPPRNNPAEQLLST